MIANTIMNFGELADEDTQYELANESSSFFRCAILLWL